MTFDIAFQRNTLLEIRLCPNSFNRFGGVIVAVLLNLGRPTNKMKQFIYSSYYLNNPVRRRYLFLSKRKFFIPTGFQLWA